MLGEFFGGGGRIQPSLGGHLGAGCFEKKRKKSQKGDHPQQGRIRGGAEKEAGYSSK